MCTGILSYVFDTDVISYLLKKDSRAAPFRHLFLNSYAIISFMTVAELERWALDHSWGEHRLRELERHISHLVTYPYNRELCRLWAVVMNARARVGRPIQCADAWIAATALQHDCPLVTHNVRDYQGIPGLQIIGPEE